MMISYAKVWAGIKPKKITYRHYFGGAAFLLILGQLLTGLYMIFYYEPSLKDTYRTVQYFNNETTLGALTRNMHRYGAFLIGVMVFTHFWRSYFRRDYQGGRKWSWITGMLLGLLYISFLVSGTILPWEWKGYWMMEMFNNWLKNIPLAGDTLYTFFMTSYTPTRNFVLHDIILPIAAFILLEIHLVGRWKKRGFAQTLARQAVASIPLLVAVLAMSVIFQVPSGDPEILPLPMEGVYVPAPEWYFVSFLMPYWYFPPRQWSFFLFWIPLALFLSAFLLPFLNKRKTKKSLQRIPVGRLKLMGLAYAGVGLVICLSLVFGFVWASAPAPWMGCNSCHNRAMGARMGIPPVTYKDTERNPLLLDKRWMMRHWYAPQVVW